MALYLVVAHQTSSSEELLEKLQATRKEDGKAEFVLLVPATPVTHLWTWIEGGELENARYRASQAATVIRQAGLRLIDTVIGSSDPLNAVRHELAQPDRAYQAVIVSTLPQGMSHWLRFDLPNQIRNKCGIKVIAVVSKNLRRKRISSETAIPSQLDTTRTRGQLDLGTLAALRRSEVHCLDGRLGTLTQIMYDYVSLEPVWLGIASRPIPFRTLLLPAQASRLDAGHLMIPFKRDKVLGQPHVDIGEGIPNLMDEEHLYEYFGISQDRLRELRMLHMRDDVPGLEVNWQRIFEDEDVTRRTGLEHETDPDLTPAHRK